MLKLRTLLATMLCAGSVIAPATARATCYSSIDDQGRQLDCCSAPGGPSTCRVVTAEEQQRRREATRRWQEARRKQDQLRQQRERASWRAYQRRRSAKRLHQRQRRVPRPTVRRSHELRWNNQLRGAGIELSASPYFCFTGRRVKDTGSFYDTASGLELGFGWRYWLRYRRGRGGGHWVGSLVPRISPHVWLGNHLGADLRVRVGGQHRSIDGTNSPSLSFDLVPILRVAPRDSRMRWPSVASVIVPHLGVQLVRDRPTQLRLRLLNLSCGYLLSDWLLLEVELGALLRLPLGDEQPATSSARAGLDASLRLVVPL